MISRQSHSHFCHAATMTTLMKVAYPQHVIPQLAVVEHEQ